MRLKNLISCFLLSVIASSCIQNEAPNSEADIITCEIGGDILNRKPIISNDEITLFIKDGVDMTNVKPVFTFTEGATINPPNGTSCDFTKSQSYTFTVTSQDKKWSKDYFLKVLYPINTDYNFENYKLGRDGKFYIFYEKHENDNEIMSWASGNEGFAYAGVLGPDEKPVGADQYPTTIENNGYNGTKCAKLQTKRTGGLGESIGMPLAAGNLFLGSFKINLSDILSATKFGVPFTHIPTTMEGVYKYKAGDVFYKLNSQNKLEEVPGRKDFCDIYAVFYEVSDAQESLTGHNVLDQSNPNIISIARSTDNVAETNVWAPFSYEFITLPGRKVNEVKLAEGKYNLAVVFSSSIRGDHFEGAPESTLWIDDVKIDYEGK